MPIPLAQLETWSHIGNVTSSKSTYASIKNCIEKHTFPEKVTYNIYLQGSYGNSTNIRGNSDVDLVVQLTSSFRPKTKALNETELTIFNKKYKDATYDLSDFRKEVLDTLKENYDESKISEGNKAIKLEGNGGRINADIVICLTYRYFFHVHENQTDNYVEGIAFQDKIGNWIYSYPKQHLENGQKKMAQTNNNYKKIIRIYKNIKGKLENDDSTPDTFLSSHFIESLIFNVPDELFTGTISEIFLKTLNWLNNEKFDDFKCQHGLFNLFGTAESQCDITQAKTFISEIVDLWNNW
ncbi:MAG: nucleotidyltransferase [archaeon]